MKALEVYYDYVALKSHFHGQYDYFKCNGKTRASLASFEKRRDKAYFIKLSKHKDHFRYILANLIYSDYWIGEIAVNQFAEENYKRLLKVHESLAYTLQTDLKKIPNWREAVEVIDGHPPILILYMGNEITLESLTIIAHLTNAIGYWDRTLGDDIVWQTIKRRITKYKGFLKVTKRHKELVYYWSKNTNNTNNTSNIGNTDVICRIHEKSDATI